MSEDVREQQRAAIPAAHFQRLIAASVVALSVASFLLNALGSVQEPYVTFRAVDAFLQIGVASALIALWLLLLAAVFYGVGTARLHRAWLFLLPWAAFVLFYLSYCPQGYIADLTKLTLGR